MAVYVDPLTPCPISANWHWNGSCHLIADSVDELHAFAASIGMKRAWFQNHTRMPHYDLNAARRAVAVLNGAVEIGRVEFVLKMRAWRAALERI